MLTPERRAKLTKQLEEAEDAYHSVSIGGTVRVFVDQTGERVEYGPANAAQLQKYIFSLRLQLGLTCAAGPFETWM